MVTGNALQQWEAEARFFHFGPSPSDAVLAQFQAEYPEVVIRYTGPPPHLLVRWPMKAENFEAADRAATVWLREAVYTRWPLAGEPDIYFANLTCYPAWVRPLRALLGRNRDNLAERPRRPQNCPW